MYYKTGEVAKILGISIQTLRTLEKNGVLVPERSITDRRIYKAEHVADFQQKQRMVSNEKYTSVLYINDVEKSKTKRRAIAAFVELAIRHGDNFKISDITKESGLSGTAIYKNFSNKNEIEKKCINNYILKIFQCAIPWNIYCFSHKTFIYNLFDCLDQTRFLREVMLNDKMLFLKGAIMESLKKTLLSQVPQIMECWAVCEKYIAIKPSKKAVVVDTAVILIESWLSDNGYQLGYDLISKCDSIAKGLTE